MRHEWWTVRNKIRERDIIEEIGSVVGTALQLINDAKRGEISTTFPPIPWRDFNVRIFHFLGPK